MTQVRHGAPLRALLQGVVLPMLEQLTPTRFWSYYKESVRFQRWTDARRTALRQRRLGTVLNRALGSAFHCQRLKAAGLKCAAVTPQDADDVLAALAPVGKQELRRHFPGDATTRRTAENWRFISTAGTTDRMSVIHDFGKRDQCRSAELHTLSISLGAEVAVRTVEIPPNACNIVCGLEDRGPQSFLGYLWHALQRGTLLGHEARTELRGRVERGLILPRQTLPPMTPAAPAELSAQLDKYLETLARLQPVYLRAHPLYLVWLAAHCRSRGTALPNLRLLSPMGGLTSPEMHKRISAGFGAPFRNKYGTSEFGSVAVGCGHGHGMHVFEDWFMVEVFRDGRPAQPGELGRLVITDLVNTAMPLVRYDVGDVSRIYRDPCPCGRDTARVEVLGRVQELLETPAGPLTAAGVANAFFADPGVANFRLEEIARGVFEAAVVPSDSEAAPDLNQLQDRFAALYPGLRKLRARTVAFVQPEPSGKYRFVHPARPSTDLP